MYIIGSKLAIKLQLHIHIQMHTHTHIIYEEIYLSDITNFLKEYYIIFLLLCLQFWFEFGFPGCSKCKESACNVGHLGWIPESGRSPGGGHGHPF